jgi:hypothetical protein
MLAMIVLVAGLFGPKPAYTAPAGATCPVAPAATFATRALTCPALEVSGSADANGVAIDPAFDVSIEPAKLARPSDGAAAVLAGFAADGRQLFALPFAANGPFHVYVPLPTQAQQQLERLTLTTEHGAAERKRAPSGAPAAEIISLSDDRVIVAWNADAYPTIRIAEAAGKAALAVGAGTSTFEQVSVDTRARRLFVTFSDGVQSTTRGFTIFGRR